MDFLVPHVEIFLGGKGVCGVWGGARGETCLIGVRYSGGWGVFRMGQVC